MGWLDELGDAASDLGGDIFDAAGEYVKGTVKEKFDGKSALPDTQPAVHNGEVGTGKASAMPAGAQVAPVGALPSWVVPAAVAAGVVLVLGVTVSLVRG